MNTSEELSQALAVLAARADGDQPPDRLDRVHRRARRTARARVAGAALVAVLVAGTASAVVARSLAGPGPAVPGGQQTTAQPAPSTTATTASPQPTPTPTRTPTASPKASGLVPADSRYPAAGTCLPAAGPVVTVDANPDVPSPRCLVVRADQRLRVVNTSDLHGSVGTVITVRFADFAPRVLQVGRATTFDRPVGEFLAVGVHRVQMPPLYGGTSGAEIWLR